MEEKNSFLMENEKIANKIAAKVMRVTFIIFTLIYILDIIGIFVVDKGIMTVAYILGSIMLWTPTILVDVIKINNEKTKYINTLCAVLFVAIMTTTLTYHVVALYIYGIAISSLYFSKRLNVFATVLSVICVSIGQILAFILETLPDKNFRVMNNLIVYSVIPRAMVLIAVAAIFTMLCKRTALMLSNLMGADEQKKMLDHMTRMKEKSKETSNNMLQMVKELAVITEASTKANEEIAQESGVMLQSSADNTKEIESINEKIHEITLQLAELSEMNDTIAELAEQVNENTKENQERMNYATESMEQIHESTKECRDVISNLGEESKEILGIIKVITGISSRTNILALNATIEAARAGEHGKGFAVVAQEIQKLSEQTKSAVEDIRIIVNQVVGNTEEAVTAMENSARLTQMGMESIKEAGVTTSLITKSNNEMSGKIISMDKIAETVNERSREVSVSMDQVNENTRQNYNGIEHVTAATQENSAGTESIAQMVTSISRMAEEMEKVVRG